MRQVVRDIHELDGCLQSPEVRILLEIDRHGTLTRVQLVPDPITGATSQWVRACVRDRLRGWEFAAAASSGTLLVVYRPRDRITRSDR
jgi:hypothetical protein